MNGECREGVSIFLHERPTTADCGVANVGAGCFHELPHRHLRTRPPQRRRARDRAAPRLDGEDALIWAKRVWEDRDTWLRARGGVESVFMAAQLMGCREEAVRWLRSRTRL
jgi:hypothetical protein